MAYAALELREDVLDRWQDPQSARSNRYFDRKFGAEAVKLLPGEFAGSGDGTMLVTILGSCVAACLFDPDARVGGMNHFMLPGEEASGSGSGRYGIHAMELLINRLVGLGAARPRLRAKLFGGAAVVRSMTQTDVGGSNIEFVERYLRTEGIPIVASDLGGPWPRRVHFFGESGRVFVKRLPVVEASRIVRDESQHYQQLAQKAGESGSVELFS
ncbi:MAG: chemoreceptor glutamine deamidase CheD [Abyssibacter sp.]|jgi:chemotaxis protein CheD|uniref:chemoreceptor glutamine deamidase CheD n=1 Tax=Abyssibacter sp. TaxID=2320200 RepID=UPI003219ACC5